MIRRGWAGLVLAGGWLLAGNATAEDYDPFRISREQFSAEVRTVALQPVRHSRSLPDAKALRARLAEKLSARLRAAGLRVIPSREWEERWRRHSEQLGGVFDPVTGSASAEAFKAVRDFTLADLVADFKIDALLRPSIFWRDVRWDSVAPWFRVTSLGEFVTWKGESLVFAERPRNAPQRIVAPHLGLSIQSRAGVTLFDIGCGIRWQTVYIARSFEDRPMEEVFASDRIDAAIDLCTQPLFPSSKHPQVEP